MSSPAEEKRITELKLQIAEELPYPPKPKRKDYTFLGLIEKPTTPEGKLVFTAASAVAFGTFVGACRAWFYDYKKVPNIQYMQSLRVNARYIRAPLLVAGVVGTTWAGVEYAMDHYNKNYVRPINAEKEESLTQKFWKATLAGTSTAVVTGKPAIALQIGVASGIIYYYYSWMSKRGGVLERLRAKQQEKLNSTTNPQLYKPLDRAYIVNDNRVVYNFFYEERADRAPRKPLSKVEYVEE